MDRRQQELSRLRVYTANIEKEVTLLIQNLQWNPDRITEKRPLVACTHDSNHRIPMDGRDNHEKQCYLRKLGYSKEDALLPDPLNPDSNTLVKFSKHKIAEIINNAAVNNPLFKRGVGCQELEPLSAERLQRAYTADERRAIHDAVVDSAPFCHDLAELDLLSVNDDVRTSQKKSRLEILAELRNMKRRRTKYRVPPKTRNYSDVLRDVIKTQMDSYGESSRTIIKTEYGPNIYVSQKDSNKLSEIVSPRDVVIKLERESPEALCRNRNTGEYPRDRSIPRSRENKYYHDRKGFYEDNIQTSKEMNRNYGVGHQSEQLRGCTERNREKRYDDKTSHHTDKYSSRERIKNYDDSYQIDNNRDCNKDKSRYDDDRHRYRKDYSSKVKNNTYESYKRGIQARRVVNMAVEQQRQSHESESSMNYSRDRHRDKSRSREKRHKNARIKKHSKDKDKHDDRGKIRPERHSTEKVIKQEIESPEYDSFNSGDTSRKRQKSRSKEKRHKHKKRRREDDIHSSRGVEEHEERRRDFTSEIIIKQEKESS